ncbi:hypothetical protein HPB48_026035 [Haemaphysalis longicornis]|uniref:Uncharacterized protein n=1 Tax=Haemaphysalis longicornis TaxID=44386 RepID=A0A9J6HBC3_HAELO|nr:hypothetical protein HPB48_026035 [Haemaphysalis longicornis]
MVYFDRREQLPAIRSLQQHRLPPIHCRVDDERLDWLERFHRLCEDLREASEAENFFSKERATPYYSQHSQMLPAYDSC